MKKLFFIVLSFLVFSVFAEEYKLPYNLQFGDSHEVVAQKLSKITTTLNGYKNSDYNCGEEYFETKDTLHYNDVYVDEIRAEYYNNKLFQVLFLTEPGGAETLMKIISSKYNVNIDDNENPVNVVYPNTISNLYDCKFIVVDEKLLKEVRDYIKQCDNPN